MPCAHASWTHLDDDGSHFCDDCGLFHAGPHSPADDPSVCDWAAVHARALALLIKHFPGAQLVV